MKKQVLVIHGGNAFDTYEKYIAYLTNKKLTLDDLEVSGWKQSLGKALGKDFEVFLPQMPNARNARYLEWKIWFEKIIPLLNEEIVLVGHSLGGLFLAKYLSENDCSKKIVATFLVAAPFNTKTKFDFVDFVLKDNSLKKMNKQGGKIFIFQSEDDEVVPYADSKKYKKVLPDSKMIVFKDRGHFHQPNFPEIVKEIKKVLN